MPTRGQIHNRGSVIVEWKPWTENVSTCLWNHLVHLVAGINKPPVKTQFATIFNFVSHMISLPIIQLSC